MIESSAVLSSSKPRQRNRKCYGNTTCRAELDWQSPFLTSFVYTRRLTSWRKVAWFSWFSRASPIFLCYTSRSLFGRWFFFQHTYTQKKMTSSGKSPINNRKKTRLIIPTLYSRSREKIRLNIALPDSQWCSFSIPCQNKVFELSLWLIRSVGNHHVSQKK